jgi:hypothetical protein
MDGNNDVYPLPVGPNDLCFEKSEFVKVRVNFYQVGVS